MLLSSVQVAKALVAADVLVAKMVSRDPQAVFRTIELRMYRAAMRIFTRRATRGIETALAWIKYGDGNLTPADVKIVLSILSASFKKIEQSTEAVVEETVRAAYREGARLARRQIRASKKRRVRKAIGSTITSAFNVADENAVRAFTRQQRFWIGRHYAENLSDRIAVVCTKVMLEEGLHREDAAAELESTLRVEFGIDEGGTEHRSGISLPQGWRGTTGEYFSGLAVNTTTVARISGAVREFQRAKVSTYKITAVGDDRMCEECGFMDGKEFSVDEAGGVVDSLVNAKDPASVKTIQRWDKLGTILQRTGLSKTDRGRVSGAKSGALMRAGYGLPPFHFKCRCTADISEHAIIGDLDYSDEYDDVE